jgi:hypothetical protein
MQARGPARGNAASTLNIVIVSSSDESDFINLPKKGKGNMNKAPMTTYVHVLDLCHPSKVHRTQRQKMARFRTLLPLYDIVIVTSK